MHGKQTLSKQNFTKTFHKVVLSCRKFHAAGLPAWQTGSQPPYYFCRKKLYILNKKN